MARTLKFDAAKPIFYPPAQTSSKYSLASRRVAYGQMPENTVWEREIPSFLLHVDRTRRILPQPGFIMASPDIMRTTS
jgi:hypothetical protein